MVQATVFVNIHNDKDNQKEVHQYYQYHLWQKNENQSQNHQWCGSDIPNNDCIRHCASIVRNVALPFKRKCNWEFVKDVDLPSKSLVYFYKQRDHTISAYTTYNYIWIFAPRQKYVGITKLTI